MLIDVLKSKIGSVTITQAELYYEGSITIDENLMKAANISAWERVEVLNVNNGNRFSTYVIKGEPGSGTICLNGPAARLGVVGDKIIILSYAAMTPEELKAFQPRIIKVDDNNKIKN
jgi:aspartate 1-decarboxylase